MGRFDRSLVTPTRLRYVQERSRRRARATAPVVLPVIKKGERLRDQLDTHASYWTEYAMYKGKERELQFPHAVCVSYQNGDRGKSGEVVRGYVACDLTDRTPKLLSATDQPPKPGVEARGTKQNRELPILRSRSVIPITNDEREDKPGSMIISV